MNSSLWLAVASLAGIGIFSLAVAVVYMHRLDCLVAAKLEPIIDTQKKHILGYECLRFRLGAGPGADWSWYYAVTRWLRKHFANEESVERNYYYAINFDSSELLSLRFRLWAARTARRGLAERIVLEWTEHTHYRNEARMERARLKAAQVIIQTHLRWGFRIAIDDWGEGMDAMGRIALLVGSAETVKISHRLFHLSRESMRLTHALSHLVHAAHACGTRVIVEGVENSADLNRATAIRADGVQGYLFHHHIVKLNAEV